MVPNKELHILTIHFEPPNRGQLHYKIKDKMSGVSFIKEVPLYICNWLQLTKINRIFPFVRSIMDIILFRPDNHKTTRSNKPVKQVYQVKQTSQTGIPGQTNLVIKLYLELLPSSSTALINAISAIVWLYNSHFLS